MDLFEKYQLPKPAAFSQDIEIMVAEANNDLRLIIDHHLRKLGFLNLRIARDGRQCLGELQCKSAHISLVGDDLPSVSGLEILRELRENPSIVRETFVLLTVPLQKNEVMLAVETGVDDLLVRPVAPNDILPKLQSAYQSFTHPKNPERVYEFAKSKLRDNDLDVAQAVYQDLASINAKAARPFVGLARIAQKRGDVELGLLHLGEAISRNGNYVHAYSLRAEFYVESNQIGKAVEDFRTAVQLSPLSLIRYEQACEVMLKHNLVKECLTILEMAIAADLHHPFVVERLGYCYFVEKDYPKALRYLRQAVRLEPDNTSYLNSLAICYRDAGMFDESIETYNRILKKENENHFVMFNKAIIYERLNRTDEAIKLLKRVLKIDGNYEKAKEKLLHLGGTLD